MPENVQYLFTNQDTPQGALVLRSIVNSYGIDHATDKDLYSFYIEFSKKAYTDTGLLPVNGTGLLSIRSALNHTQVAYQYAPGNYYINWGEVEGDPNAKKYYIAQPYRIVIIDFIDDNILGARTFYSPYPITHPKAQLYHVNLPNINCRGYRGNGVGWICLYHNEDISTYPFNERLIKALERCSGVEAYNNANMSETDGTRFYQEYRREYPFLYDPVKWEQKTAQEGYEWTLDENLWIPILVQNFDKQDRHDSNGIPLTFVDALFGNYKAYYHDDDIPKPVNAISRDDLELDYNKLFNNFKISYIKSSSGTVKLNTFSMSEKVKEELANKVTVQKVNFSNVDIDQDEEEDPDYAIAECAMCGYQEEYAIGEDYPESFYFCPHDSIIVCNPCFEEYFVEIPEFGFVSTNSKLWNKFVKNFQTSFHFCVLDNFEDINIGLPHNNKDHSLPVSFVQPLLNNTDTNDVITFYSSIIPETAHHFNISGSVKFEFEFDQVKDFIFYVMDTYSINTQQLINPYLHAIFSNIKSSPHLFKKQKIVFNLHAMCGECFKQIFNNEEVESFSERYQKMKNYLLNTFNNYIDQDTEELTGHAHRLIFGDNFSLYIVS